MNTSDHIPSGIRAADIGRRARLIQAYIVSRRLRAHARAKAAAAVVQESWPGLRSTPRAGR